MNVASWLLWGFIATVVMTTVSTGAQGMGLTRMNIPLMLGAIVVEGRDRAKWIGTLMHMVFGYLFALIYVAIFESVGRAGLLFGGVIGLCHALAILTILMSLLPSFHRGMATELQGPATSRRLEPPGFLALHYGPATPLTVIVSHVAYGMMLGAFYAVR